jgi:hypothetical protein
MPPMTAIIESRLITDAQRERKPRTVLLGSFRAHDAINATIDVFVGSGVKVLAPKRSRIIAEESGFAILESDKPLVEKMRRQGASSEEISNAIERKFLSHFSRADFIYIVNPQGYNGLSVTFELGRAAGYKKPIYPLEPLDITDSSSSTYRGIAQEIKVYSPKDLAEMAQNDALDTHGYWWCR